MSLWLADPVTREALPAIPSRERELSYRETHWRPGWRSGFEWEGGVPARMWFAMCPDPCCVEYWAKQPPLETLVEALR